MKTHDLRSKIIFIFLAILLSSPMFFFNSCRTAGYGIKSLGVYDSTVPKDQLSTLFFSCSYTITKFDGVSVNWRVPGILPNATIQIPPGEHEIEFTYYYCQPGGGSAPSSSKVVSSGGVYTTWNMSGGKNTDEKIDKVVSFKAEPGVIYEFQNKEIKIYKGTIDEKHLKYAK